MRERPGVLVEADGMWKTDASSSTDMIIQCPRYGG